MNTVPKEMKLFVLILALTALGRWMDRFGIKAMLYADALSLTPRT